MPWKESLDKVSHISAQKVVSHITSQILDSIKAQKVVTNRKKASYYPENASPTNMAGYYYGQNVTLPLKNHARFCPFSVQ